MKKIKIHNITLYFKALLMENNYLSQLSEIKKIIEERTRFHFLSGISGILAGTYALIGAYLAYRIIYFSQHIVYDDIYDLSLGFEAIRLIMIFGVVLILSIMTGLIFSWRKANKDQSKLWNSAALKVLYNFSIPMIIGGIFILYLFNWRFIVLIAPSSLIFYGLALINASNYTFSDVRKLGLTICILGIINLAFPGYGLLFWALGFGVAHILYGLIMYLKYER